MKEKISDQLYRLLPLAQKITSDIHEAEDNWPRHFNQSDPEDNYLRNMYYQIADKLDDIERIVKAVNGEVYLEGKLYKNEDGRYAITDFYYFTSGRSIEILIEKEDSPYWFSSRVEHNGEDYYVVGYRGSMDGLMARVKQ